MRHAFAAFILVLCLLLGGCGTDDSGPWLQATLERSANQLSTEQSNRALRASKAVVSASDRVQNRTGSPVPVGVAPENAPPQGYGPTTQGAAAQAEQNAPLPGWPGQDGTDAVARSDAAHRTPLTNGLLPEVVPSYRVPDVPEVIPAHSR